MKPSDIPFQTLCSFFSVCQQKMTPTLRHKHLRHFREKFIERTSEDVFSIYRLLAPAVSAGMMDERTSAGCALEILTLSLCRAAPCHAVLRQSIQQ
jgi:hypothetical protein